MTQRNVAGIKNCRVFGCNSSILLPKRAEVEPRPDRQAGYAHPGTQTDGNRKSVHAERDCKNEHLYHIACTGDEFNRVAIVSPGATKRARPRAISLTSKHVVIENPDGLPFISGLHTIVAKSKTNELFHAYRRFCFQTAEVKAQFRFFAVGTKVSGISKTNIAKVELSFPSVPEQTAIATILSDMDTEIAALETNSPRRAASSRG